MITPHEFALYKSRLTEEELSSFPAHNDEVMESYDWSPSKAQEHSCELCCKYATYNKVKALVQEFENMLH